MSNKSIILTLIAIWAVAFLGSVFLAWAIDGPRNIETGFRRLDRLVVGQGIAAVVALLTAVMGFVLRGGGWRQRLLGLVPLGVTLVLIGGLIAMAAYSVNQTPQQPPPSTTTQPVPDPAPDAATAD